MSRYSKHDDLSILIMFVVIALLIVLLAFAN